jgi:hypothetical protein
MFYETGTSVKLETVDGTKISWNLVQSDNDIDSVRKGTWWNLSNNEDVINPYYYSTNLCENMYIYYYMTRKQGVFIIRWNKFQ